MRLFGANEQSDAIQASLCGDLEKVTCADALCLEEVADIPLHYVGREVAI